MLSPYNPDDHYWWVAGKLFSSAAGSFVTERDKDYAAWLSSGGPTTIDSAASLMGVLWRVSSDYPGLVDRCREALGNPPCRRRFRARELVALLTADDHAKIKAACAATPALDLLWSRLMVQGEEPVDTKVESVQQGIAGLVSALGQERVDQLLSDLGIERS